LKFSTRTNWNRRPNRLSRLLDDRRKRGEVVYDLTVSNPTECGIKYPKREILAALSNPDSLHYQPDPRGLPAARDAVCAYYREKQVRVDSSRVMLTASTSEAYAMILKLLCNTGDEILVPKPSYPLFEFLAGLNDVNLQDYPLAYDHGWHIDIKSLKDRITGMTRGIVIINPHNPTGMFLKQSEFTVIQEIAAQHHCSLIVDEVFSDYGFEKEENRVNTTADSSRALTFTLNGISKSLGLPQMKLGWVVVSGPEEETLEALARLEIISDTFLSVNTPVQVALPKLFDHCRFVRQQILNRVKSNYNFLQHSVLNAPCSVLSTEGGWYAVFRVPRTRTDEEWALKLLSEKGVYVQPGYFFDFEEEGYLVVSLLVEEKAFQHAMKRVIKVVADHQIGA